MKKFIIILFIVLPAFVFAQSGGVDNFKEKSDSSYVGDGTSVIYQSISGNLSFKDTVTGAKTLAELALGADTINLVVTYKRLTDSLTVIRDTLDIMKDTINATKNVTTNLTITGTTSPIKLNSSDGKDVYFNQGNNVILTSSSDSTVTISTGLLQPVSNGSKTASFVHYADSASIGNYNLSTTGAVTISVYNLSSGKQGTIFIDVGASNPSSVTIALYTDAGTTAISAGNIRGSTTISTTASEMSTCTYTCASDGTNVEAILISSTGL